VAGAVAIFVGGFAVVTGSALFGVAGAVLLAVGYMLIAIVTWGGRSSNTRKGVATGFVLLGVGALVAAREKLFGDGTCVEKSCSPDDIGWFGRDALPWLSEPWWHAPFVLAVFSVLAYAIGVVAARPWKKKRAAAAVD